MSEILIALVFVIGYIAITLEHVLKINKAAVALVTGVLCWTIYIVNQSDSAPVLAQLTHHFGDISQILFFLLGAMVIVEVIDAHDGFEIITSQVKTKSKRKLLWLISLISFFLSAALDNLTTTIIMISLIRKLIPNAEQRLFFVGMIVIAANAGGAWSPIGDITTTMLWIGGQITAVNIIKMLLVPSLVCILVPLIIASRSIGGEIAPFPAIEEPKHSSNFQRNLIFSLGVGTLLLIPIFKTVTHLPPVMGMLLGLGVVWILTEMINHRSEEEPQKNHTVHSAIRRIDAPSILFFLGILLAVSALQVVGSLSDIADWLNNNVGSLTLIGITIGFLSAVVDNVPLVAAAQGMYSLTNYPPNHYFWELLAFCTGTGGSALIIGSAAGVAAMGLEKINFFWYLKNISLLAVIGYLSGVVVYLLQMNL